jgi:hypothetical protein
MILGFVLGALFVALLVVAYWVGYERGPRVAHMAPTFTTPSGTFPVDHTLTFSDEAPNPPASVGPRADVTTEANGVVTVPPSVVAACIAEARGNNAVLERALSASADLLALGMSERDVMLAVQAGDVEAA